MAENIFVAFLTTIAVVAAIWCRWFETKGDDKEYILSYLRHILNMQNNKPPNMREEKENIVLWQHLLSVW